MSVIGLTGGIGAGKSYVAALFARLGAQIIDADEVCRGIYEPGGDCLSEVIGVFGTGILNSDGTIDRAALGKIVFSDRESLDRLNAIAHKYIARAIDDRIDRFTNGQKRVIIIDAPQLFEAGMERRCDAVISVIAPLADRIARITARDGVDESAARARIAMQYDDDFFCAHSAYVIRNGADDCLQEQVERIYKSLEEL